MRLPFEQQEELSEASDREEQQECDQKRENAQSLGHCEAEDQAAELAFDRRRIAQRAVQELAEERADANAGGPRSDGGEEVGVTKT
jgi:hypothetical protein